MSLIYVVFNLIVSDRHNFMFSICVPSPGSINITRSDKFHWYARVYMWGSVILNDIGQE